MKWAILLSTATLLISIKSHAQILEFIESKNIDWASWESVRYKAEKLALLDSFIKQLPDAIPKPTKDNIGDFLTTDLEADGDPDIVYKGGRAENTVFLRNDEGKLSVILNEEGRVVSMKRDKVWNPVTFQLIRTIGDEQQIINYHFFYNNGEIGYEKVNTFIAPKNMKLIPENTPPVKFKTTDQPLRIRSHPDPLHGKIIKTYPENTTGFAIASLLNISNNIWRLVIIREDKNHFRLGWIQGNELGL
jgi:hypothetical protein